MTKQELMSMPNLAISEETKFVHIHTEKGYFITEKELSDVKAYQGFECMYAPIKDEYPDYKVITEAEHLENERIKNEAIEAEIKAKEEKRKEEMLNKTR